MFVFVADADRKPWQVDSFDLSAADQRTQASGLRSTQKKRSCAGSRVDCAERLSAE